MTTVMVSVFHPISMNWDGISRRWELSYSRFMLLMLETDVPREGWASRGWGKHTQNWDKASAVLGTHFLPGWMLEEIVLESYVSWKKSFLMVSEICSPRQRRQGRVWSVHFPMSVTGFHFSMYPLFLLVKKQNETKANPPEKRKRHVSMLVWHHLEFLFIWHIRNNCLNYTTIIWKITYFYY